MQHRYSLGAIILHWTIAIAVIVNWRIAESTEGVSETEAAGIMSNHMALGMVILALSVLRLIWRWTHTRPPFAQDLARWEVILARIVHTVFYVLLLALPLMGWVASSTYNAPVDVFGIFSIPALPLSKNEALGHEIFEIHGTLGSIMIYLIGLHVLGALKHHFVDKNGEIYRMLPFGRSRA